MVARRRGKTRPLAGPNTGAATATSSAQTDAPPLNGPDWRLDAPMPSTTTPRMIARTSREPLNAAHAPSGEAHVLRFYLIVASYRKWELETVIPDPKHRLFYVQSHAILSDKRLTKLIIESHALPKQVSYPLHITSKELQPLILNQNSSASC